MRTGDVIAAVASAPGRSPRAVVRLSGDGLPALLASWTDCSRAPEGEGHEGRRPEALRTRVHVGSGWLPALMLRGWAPRTYTGEHAVEFLVPGGPALVARLLADLTAMEGVRAAEPGEFTARAFLHGRLGIDQAEGVALAIAARSEAERRAAGALLSGETGERRRAWAEEIASCLALVEAGIDFTDQDDVVPITPADLRRRLSAVISALRAELGADAGSALAQGEGVTVVLAGPPNAGKSTLFNALLGRARAVASDAAGTTRDAIREALPGTGGTGPEITLVDVAGLDEALARRGPADAASQGAALRALAGADVVLLCDPAGRFDTPAPELLPPGAAVLRVRTMADRVGTQGGAADARVCALDGWGVSALRRAIEDAASAGAGAGAASAYVLPRHRRALRETLERLEEALGLAEGPGPGLERAEVVALALRRGLDAIGEVTGRIAPDDVLGRIFAGFCVGK